MKTKKILLALSVSLALIGSAQAQSQGGFKGWMKQKKEQIQKATTREPAVADDDGDIKDANQRLDAYQEKRSTTAKQPTNLPSVVVKGQQPGKPPVNQQKAIETAGKGCAIGGVIGGLLGVDPQIGCAVGGLAGYGFSYKKQIKDAREVETAAREAGMDATVRTEQRVDEKGKKQEALAALIIRYEAADMEAMGPKTVAMLDRLASLTTKSKSTLTIRFEGKKACQIPLVELNNRKALERHTVLNDCGKSDENKIVVSPLPVAR